MMNPEPQPQHAWLQGLVGEWTTEMDGCDGPEAPGEKSRGRESVRSIGGLWVECEGQHQMPDGGPGTTLMTLGYDPQRGKFVGTFIGSMMTYLWVYEGELDAAGKVLTLNAEGPDFANAGKTARYRDVIELRSDDHRVLSSYMLGEDGEWRRFMTAHYRRTE